MFTDLRFVSVVDDWFVVCDSFGRLAFLDGIRL
jgi:hypothetical protein